MTFSSDDGTIYLLFVVFAIPILIFFPLVVRFIKLLRIQATIRSKTIIAMYESPVGLSPAEIGYLYDMKLQSREFVATLFDLEHRNYLVINGEGGIMTVANTTNDLKPHEALLIQMISKNELHNINDTITPGGLLMFSKLVRDSLINLELMNRSLIRGYVVRALKITLFVSPLTTTLFIVWLAIATGIGPDLIVMFVLLMSLAFLIFFLPFYILLGIILTVIYVRIDGARWIGTKKLRDIWSDIEGYKIFIKQTQAERLRFANEELKATSKERDLAYAIAMNINVDWKARFNNKA